ncbi:hypothetical protein BDR03DRAFT_971553 [Suillus americanus]|nr:hypothetical protein BDR03DRAFT_971553 [Suillus americanus]
MRFTSLRATTVIITAAAMAGVVIASGPDIPCVPNKGGCSAGVKGYNNGNAFGYMCGPDGHVHTWYLCSCNDPTCCVVAEAGGVLWGQCK